MTTHHRTTRALAAAGLALTIGGAQASARPIAFTPEGSQPATRTVAVAPRSHVSEPTIVRVTSGNGGFDWGDAGIGAAGRPRALDARCRRRAARHGAAPVASRGELRVRPTPSQKGRTAQPHASVYRCSPSAAGS